MGAGSPFAEAQPDDPVIGLCDLRFFGLDAGARPPADAPPGLIAVGIHTTGPLPQTDGAGFDILLTTAPGEPRPWVSIQPDRLDAVMERVRLAVEHRPIAAATAAQVLRISLDTSLDGALAIESLAYSMLLGSAEFRAWRRATPVRARSDLDEPRVQVAREAGVIHIRLARPKARNAVDAAMRDALVEALEFALDDPDQAPVVLSGLGAAFSVGGDLDEFGEAADPARAHIIRVSHSVARLIARLKPRITARLHRACIGAGIEAPAAAGAVIAHRNAYFRLPELSMGLIPGAGGTATLPRRIGRHRTAYMALSGADIDAETALAWGLVDGIETWR